MSTENAIPQVSPRYELDDGPLTIEQMEIIRQLCPQNPNFKISQSLFNLPGFRKVREGMYVPASSASETPDDAFTERLFDTL